MPTCPSRIPCRCLARQRGSVRKDEASEKFSTARNGIDVDFDIVFTIRQARLAASSRITGFAEAEVCFIADEAQAGRGLRGLILSVTRAECCCALACEAQTGQPLDC